MNEISIIDLDLAKNRESCAAQEIEPEDCSSFSPSYQAAWLQWKPAPALRDGSSANSAMRSN